MFNPVTANDTGVAVPPVTGDSVAAVIVVVPLKSEVDPYSNDTVVDARFAFTVPDNDTVVVPIDDAVVPLTVGTAEVVIELEAPDANDVPTLFIALTVNV